jgi:hypothetical protein
MKTRPETQNHPEPVETKLEHSRRFPKQKKIRKVELLSGLPSDAEVRVKLKIAARGAE